MLRTLYRFVVRNETQRGYNSWLTNHVLPQWGNSHMMPRALAVRQKLMRHVSITTTMNTYGDVVTDEMAHASSKIVKMDLAG